jgi:thiamine biosynthesis lipoprotein
MSEQEQEFPYIESQLKSLDNIHKFSHQAMAATFKIIIQHDNKEYAGQAARAAFDEVDRLEGVLSRYIENSEISRIHNLPAGQATRITIETCNCLSLSKQLYEQTGGVFDITIGLLLDCWRDKNRNPRTPTEAELEFAIEHTGADLILLDEDNFYAAPAVSGLQIDLGGIGKGYAVDVIADLLKLWSIDRAVISGGYSTILCMDPPLDLIGWPMTISNPADRRQKLCKLVIADKAIGSSGLQKGQHIIDPRTAKPALAKTATWCITKSAAVADALSTSFIIMTPEEIEQYCIKYKNVGAFVILNSEPEKDLQKLEIKKFGSWPQTCIDIQ